MGQAQRHHAVIALSSFREGFHKGVGPRVSLKPWGGFLIDIFVVVIYSFIRWFIYLFIYLFCYHGSTIT